MRGVTITGYADFVGSEEYNQTLSEARARTVEQELLRGFGIRDPKVSGAGESQADASTLDDPLRPNDRRVEVDLRLAP